jgi:hypothetical protein
MHPALPGQEIGAVQHLICVLSPQIAESFTTLPRFGPDEMRSTLPGGA